MEYGTTLSGIAGAINPFKVISRRCLARKPCTKVSNLWVFMLKHWNVVMILTGACRNVYVFLGVLYPVFDGTLGETLSCRDFAMKGINIGSVLFVAEHIDKAVWNGRVIWQEEFVT